MSDPFVAEVKIFAGNFAPTGYAFCNGQLFPIAQNTALFSLIGTSYGGDGETTVGLPNLQDRSPMHWGNGPGLTPRSLGEKGGFSGVTLNTAQMPQHSHQLLATGRDGRFGAPQGKLLATGTALYSTSAPNGSLSAETLPNAGGGQSHNNRQPYLGMYFIIALTGSYPSRF